MDGRRTQTTDVSASRTTVEGCSAGTVTGATHPLTITVTFKAAGA